MKKKILILGGFGFMGKNTNLAFIDDEKYEIFKNQK